MSRTRIILGGENKLFSAVVGVLISSSIFAAPIKGFSCKFNYSVNGESHEMELQASSQEKYFLIDEQIKLVSEKATVYIYYDGSYSAINLNDSKQKRYWNADAEVEPGKLFTLLVRSRDIDPAVDQVHLACKGF